MSTKKMRVQTKIEVVPFQTKLVRAALGGEITKNLGGSDAAVRAAQEGIARGYVKELLVHGVDDTGCTRQTFKARFDGNDQGEVFLENTGGKTVAERVDPSIARALAHSKGGFAKRRLTADPRLILRDDIQADEARRRQVYAELDLVDGPPPQYRSGEEPVEVLRITPAKDRGSSFGIEVTRRRRK